MHRILPSIRIPALVFLAPWGTLALSPALAGQTITINGTVSHDIYGNGDAADNGRAPGDDPERLTLQADGNTVSLTTDTVEGVLFGGNATRGNDPATASDVSDGMASPAENGYA